MNKEEISEMNGEQLATWLHDAYEQISKDVGWNTQDKCKVKFKDLPDKNKSVMLRMAQKIQVELLTPFLL